MYRFFVSFLLVLVGSCSSAEQKAEAIENPTGIQDNYEPVLTPYFDLVNALCNDDLYAAQKSAQVLSNIEVINGVHKVLKSLGGKIAGTSDLRYQREILQQMGIIIQLYIEQSSINNFTIYKFKCANVLDNKVGEWYNNTMTGANPFIGNSSRECIELIETIKPIIIK